MNIDQLIAFDRVVREGNFSRAAWALQIAQPTVTARIQALEKSMGGLLFTRNNRVVTLTARGASFLPFARQALEALQKGTHEAQQAERRGQGELRVGVLRSLTGGLVGPIMSQFLQVHPTVRCIVQESNHWELVEWLHDGRFEIAIVAWPPLGPQIADMTPLLHFQEPVHLLAHRNHTLAKMRTVTQADLIRLSNPFLFLRWWQATPVAIQQLMQQATQFADVPTDTGRYLVSNGLGVGYFNKSMMVSQMMADDVVAIEVSDMPTIVRQSALVRLSRNSTLSAPAKQFVELVREQALMLEILAER